MSKEISFYCYYDEDEKKDEIYEDSLFYRKKVSEKEFYGMQRELLKKDGKYRILPIFKNCTLDSVNYLYSKSILSRRNNWESDFGKRVSVRAEFLEDENYKKAISDSYFIPDYLYLKVWLFNEKTNRPLFDDNFIIKVMYSHDNFEYWNYSADYLALLIRNAINGNLQTSRDIEETVKRRNLDIYLDDFREIFQCEECGEKFTNLNAFFSHLLENNHYDSFLDEFPNDKEVIHVKRMLENNKKENKGE